MAVEIVFSVVAGAPDNVKVFPILNGAIEMCARGRKGPQISGARPNQYHRLGTELDNLAAVLWDVTEFADLHAGNFNLTLGWRLQVGENGIDDRSYECDDPSGKNPFEEVALPFVERVWIV